jgi:hypothetical protein
MDKRHMKKFPNLKNYNNWPSKDTIARNQATFME